MSEIYRMHGGRPGNSVSDSDLQRENDNTYEDLSASASHSELLPVTTVTSDAYLHTRNSCRFNYNRHSRARRSKTDRRTRDLSRSTGIIHSEDLKHLYLKIKIGFCVICIINALVLVFCVSTNTKFHVFPGDKGDDFIDMGDGQPKTLKLCTKCQPLKAKVGTANGLVERIRTSKYPKICCFRRVDQLLELVDWILTISSEEEQVFADWTLQVNIDYSRAYVKQEAEDIKQRCPVKTNTTYLAPEPVFAHTYMSEQNYRHAGIKDGTLTWITDGIGVQMKNMNLKDNFTVFVIQKPGNYYMYCHLRFVKKKSDGKFRHTISINRKPAVNTVKAEGTASTEGTNSVLQGIYRLEKGNELTVTATYQTLLTEGRVNYFGIYKL